MRSMLLHGALALFLVSALPLAASPVAPFSATYEVRRNGDLLGEATLRLVRDGTHWRFSSETRGTHGMARVAGVRVDETSRFRYVDGRPETLEYRYAQRTSVNARERSAVVDASAGRITLRNRRDQVDVPYVRGVLDRQLLTVALMQAIAEGRRGAQSMPVAGRSAVEVQTWSIGRIESVPMGSMSEQGWRVERQREDAGGRATVLWLDRDQGHLPLRIEQREDDGETIEMRLLRRS